MIKGVNFKFSATNAAGPAMKGFQNGLAAVQKQTEAVNRTNTSFMRGMSQNRRAFQQIGFQVTDFSVQIAGGQSAMLAFIQQGGQVLQFFGVWGAVLAGFLSVFGTLAYIFMKTGHSIGELRSALGVLPVEMEALRAVAAAVRDAFIDMANVLINNLDRIIIYASVLAGFFVGRWLVAMLAAATSVGTLSAALIFLRGALIRTGFGAIIVIIGELIYQFLRLVEAVGGFGAALGMLKDVAAEVFERIVLSMGLLPAAMSVAANKMASFFISKLNLMIATFMEFTWSVAEGLNALFGTNLSGAKLGVVTQELAAIQLGFDGAASAADASYNAIMDGVRAPLASIAALQAALAGVKDGSIDVRDLWGGAASEADGAGGGGGGSPAAAAKAEADRIKKIFEDMQSSISSSMLGSFKALLKGTKSLGETVTDILGSIIDRVIDLLMTPIFNNIAGGLASGIMGGLGLIGASYDGGGSTGAGPRAGGLDGKGGRLAVLHPRETVVDHTKGQQVGGTTVHITVNTPDAESFKRSSRQIALSMQAALSAGSR